MIAEIIAVGSEMLTPHRQDTNSLFLTGGLNKLGVSVAFKTIVGDNFQHLVSAAGIAIRRADIVIFSGGLGPTEDDLTREAAAAALGIDMHRDPAVLESLRQRFAERRIAMPPNNEKQADVLDRAILLNNKTGSAPGQWLDTAIPGPEGHPHRKIVILLPGPPSELKPMFDAECRPRLSAVLPQRYIATRMLRMALIPESTVDARTAPIYQKFTDVETTILAGSGEIQLHFSTTKPSQKEAQARVDELAELIEREMGEDIFSAQGTSLEEVVQLMLGLRDLTLSTAESCTGGLLAERLTSIPNISRNFIGGAVVYSDALKTKFANVPPALLEQYGAISPEVARALADGIRDFTGSSIGIGITGLAGPAGPTSGPDAGRPVGLVYISLSDGEDTQVKQLQLPGDRERIRLWASQHALEMLRRHLQ
jgi:nicotinamide-nucleotide amidase